ncbi:MULTISPECIES: DUF397 domain-containing protein [Streptomyces]|uniref:DUF397 domain-containing protein n=1 Tax=Streptomyces dengpaensis TaxID=2049881 RepID=A0ABM6SUQ6_9ACTN|nr:MULTISPECIES: DUF397 domain-containing protein [Streptomyces]AVH58066.1 DUF397 domain-containing protein [Streptomyces dengpaensis]PIB06442.1 DUF397 domain-containing protein [Streptomyces sp. HG99]
MSSDLNWFKSSYSSGQGGECLEIALTPTTIHIRDSKTPTAPTLTLTPTTWSAFLDSLRPAGRPAGHPA